VPGVGPKLSRVLLRHFGSLAEVRSATIEQISAVVGVTRTVAEAVSAALDRQQPSEETPETE